jgi:hypothetical protein
MKLSRLLLLLSRLQLPSPSTSLAQEIPPVSWRQPRSLFQPKKPRQRNRCSAMPLWWTTVRRLLSSKRRRFCTGALLLQPHWCSQLAHFRIQAEISQHRSIVWHGAELAFRCSKWEEEHREVLKQNTSRSRSSPRRRRPPSSPPRRRPSSSRTSSARFPQLPRPMLAVPFPASLSARTPSLLISYMIPCMIHSVISYHM